MANCHVARRQLELVEFDDCAYLGTDVEHHLDECADCRAFARDMRALRGMLAEQPRIAVPPTFEASLKARIRREAPRYREPRLAWIPTPALGAIALATVLSVGFVVRSNFAPLEPVNVASTPSAAVSLPLAEPVTVATAAVRPVVASPVATAARPVAAKYSRPARRPANTRDLQGLSAHLPADRDLSAESTSSTPFYVENRGTGRVENVPKMIYGVTSALPRPEPSETESF